MLKKFITAVVQKINDVTYCFLDFIEKILDKAISKALSKLMSKLEGKEK